MILRPLPLLNFFVAAVMFSIGLRTSGGELLDILRDRRLLVRTLLVNCILIPAIGFLLVHIFPLTPAARIGILLLAAIPGTPIALQFTRLAKARLAFAVALTFVLSVVSIAITPLVIATMPDMVRHNQKPLLFLLGSIALYIALPLWAGVGMAKRAPRVASQLVLPLGVLATVVFLFLMWETRLMRHQAFEAIRGGGAILAMFLLLILSMAIGWLIAGPDRETRRVVATSTGMRSVIVVLYIARFCFPGSNVHVVPIVYFSLMIPTNLLFHLAFTGWHKWWPVAGAGPTRPA